MLSKADPQKIDLNATERKPRSLGSLITHKIWIPKAVYDSLPWFYLIAGAAAFLATLYISDWFWILPHYLLFSAGCLHLGAIVLRRRRPADTASNESSEDT